MKRIVHVLNDLSTFFTHRQSLADHLRRENNLIILAPDHLDHAPLKQLGYDVRGYRLSRKGLNPYTEHHTFWGLVALYKELKPDVVHHFTIKPVIYGSIAARLAGVPRILNTITGLGYVFTGSGVLPKLLRPAVKALYKAALNSDKVQVIFQNRDDQSLFIELGLTDSHRSHLIPGSGVDTTKFFPAEEPPAPPYRVVLPARMLWDKGIGEFVEAARMIQQTRQDIEFELVGGLDPGNRMAIPESTIRQWEAEGLVMWRGRVDDMLKVYHACHIVCLPSYREGLPMALLEAAACGKPIVTTDAPGCREVVSEDGRSLLVPVRNALALKQALVQLVDDRGRRDAFRAENLALARRQYDSEKVNRNIAELV